MLVVHNALLRVLIYNFKKLNSFSDIINRLLFSVFAVMNYQLSVIHYQLLKAKHVLQRAKEVYCIVWSILRHAKNVLENTVVVHRHTIKVPVEARDVHFHAHDVHRNDQHVLVNAGDVHFHAHDVHLHAQHVHLHAQHVLVNAVVTHFQTVVTHFYATVTLLRQLLAPLQQKNTFFLNQNPPKIYILTYFKRCLVQPGLTDRFLYRTEMLLQFLRKFILVQFSVVQMRLTWNNSCSASPNRSAWLRSTINRLSLNDRKQSLLMFLIKPVF